MPFLSRAGVKSEKTRAPQYEIAVQGRYPFFYPFTFKLLSNRNFFNVWEHFWFSLLLTINIFNLEKDFRLFGQKIGLKIPKYRFCNPKA